MAVACLTAVADRAVAQEVETRHGMFVESVEVSLISFELFASRDGEPVTDLTAADFEVFDDGNRVEISHFEHVDRHARPLGTANEVTADDSG